MKLTATKDLGALLFLAWLAAISPFVLTYDNMGLIWAIIMVSIGLLALRNR